MQEIEQSVDIPEVEGDENIEQSSKKSKKPGIFSSPAIRFTLVIIVILVIILISLFVGGNQVSAPQSDVKIKPDVDSTPGGQIQSENPLYQRILERSNDEAAAQAATEETSFIPVPEQILVPIADLETEERVEEESVEEEVQEEDPGRPVPAPIIVNPDQGITSIPRIDVPSHGIGRDPTPQQEVNPLAESMGSFMETLSSPREFATLRVVDITSRGQSQQSRSQNQSSGENNFASSNRQSSGTISSNQANNSSPQQGSDEQFGTVLIGAGEILPAETLLSTHSDLPGSPVVVRLTSGEWRGARLIGTFTQADTVEGLLVQFNTITMESGETYPVSAYAVDGVSAEVTVASDVERRYLKRYGPILAATFISSYANARALPRRSIVPSFTGSTENGAIQEEPSTENQAFYAGIGAAANVLSADIARTAPKGPRIVLREGWPLAVLFATSVISSDQ